MRITPSASEASPASWAFYQTLSFLKFRMASLLVMEFDFS